MLKKRLIFTLLYKDGYFMLSRNFRLQKIGNYDWILKNYDFSRISRFIDELCIINVSENPNSHRGFIETLKILSQGCFIPITAGGGIRDYVSAQDCFKSGSDKVMLNSALFDYPELVSQIALDYGRQAIVGSIDFTRDDLQGLRIQKKSSGLTTFVDSKSFLNAANLLPVGDWYLNSINRDGTGQGLDMGILDEISEDLDASLIIAGGIGNSSHISIGLADDRVSGVATANLLNFVGDGLKQARVKLIHEGQKLATWQDFS